MKHTLYKARIKHLIAKRNSYLFIAVISLITNILLAGYIYTVSGSVRTYFIPPTIERPFWISNQKVSAEYLTGMSILIADLYLNVTPNNAQMKHELLLRYIDSGAYAAIKKEMLNQELKLKKEHMTVSFQLENPKVDADNLEAQLEGDVTYTFGQTALPSQRVTYLLKFVYKNGLLQLKAISEGQKTHA